MITNLTAFKRVFPFDSVSHPLLILLFILPLSVWAQIEVDFTTTINTNCTGTECDYDGPGILINELMVSPLTGDGSLWGGLTTQGAEWIELYNPDFCNEVDISCYYLGNAATDGQLYPGGYVIPPGIIVPPAGFVIIRGINASPVPADLLIENGGNTIELVVESNANVTGQVCVGGGSRLWFPNAGGWFAFYDSFGQPQDAVSWASPPANDLAAQPCVPPFPSCQSANSLVSYNDFPDNRKEYILSGTAAAFQGQSIRRIPDGGAWSGPSSPTYGTCNEDCVNLVTSTCNGTATVEPDGGVPPYSFVWNDAQFQTTQTAVGLCAGEYCVIVIDDEGFAMEECVIIEEPSYENDGDDTFCEGNVYVLPDDTQVTEPGEFTLMLQTAGGCDSLVNFELLMLPSFSFELNPQICENESFTLPDGSQVSQQGTYVVNFEMENGCDSTYTVNLSVDPVIVIPQEVVICAGEVHVLPDGNEVTEAGTYQIAVAGSECDTLYNITLGVNPTYDIQVEAAICIGESYTLPDGQVVSETNIYESSFETAQGCDSTITTLLFVSQLPNLSIPISNVFCYQHGVVAVNPTPPGGTLTGSFVSGNELNLSSAPPGNYTINYDYTDDIGCSNSIQHDYTVLPGVNPEYTYSADCFNVAEFNNLTPDPDQIYNYTWTIEDEVFSNAVSPSYAYEEIGEFVVTLTVVNSANCAYSISQEVLLEEGLQLTAYQIPNVITPNGDQINDRLGLMPAEDRCLQYTITVFNRWGKQVYQMTESSVPFAGRDENGNELADGVYFYIFESPQIDCNNVLFEPLCNGSITVLR